METNNVIIAHVSASGTKVLDTSTIIKPVKPAITKANKRTVVTEASPKQKAAKLAKVKVENTTPKADAPKASTKPVKAKPVAKAAKPSKAVSEVLDPTARKASRVTGDMLKLLTHEQAIGTISKNIERYRAQADAIKERYGYKAFSLHDARKVIFTNPFVNCPSAYLGDKAVIERLVGAGKLKLVSSTDSDVTLQLTQVRL